MEPAWSEQVQLPLILPHDTSQPHLSTSFVTQIYAKSRVEVKRVPIELPLTNGVGWEGCLENHFQGVGHEPYRHSTAGSQP
jgi:hypothetical protein